MNRRQFLRTASYAALAAATNADAQRPLPPPNPNEIPVGPENDPYYVTMNPNAILVRRPLDNSHARIGFAPGRTDPFNGAREGFWDNIQIQKVGSTHTMQHNQDGSGVLIRSDRFARDLPKIPLDADPAQSSDPAIQKFWNEESAPYRNAASQVVDQMYQQGAPIPSQFRSLFGNPEDRANQGPAQNAQPNNGQGPEQYPGQQQPAQQQPQQQPQQARGRAQQEGPTETNPYQARNGATVTGYSKSQITAESNGWKFTFTQNPEWKAVASKNGKTVNMEYHSGTTGYDAGMTAREKEFAANPNSWRIIQGYQFGSPAPVETGLARPNLPNYKAVPANLTDLVHSASGAMQAVNEYMARARIPSSNLNWGALNEPNQAAPKPTLITGPHSNEFPPPKGYQKPSPVKPPSP